MVLGFTGAFLGLRSAFLPVIVKDVFQQDVGFYSRLMTFSVRRGRRLIVAYIGKHRHIGRLMRFSWVVRRGDGAVLAVADAGVDAAFSSSPARSS